ncbi:Uncharacterised protein [uncultured archaeon]|nr:Uncharacterised protein [uncultured archaeon]
MKKIGMFIVLVIILNTCLVSSMIISSYGKETIIINSIEQLCEIQNKEDLYCNTLLDISFNRTSDPLVLEISDKNLGNPVFSSGNVRLCKLGERGSSPGDYLNFNFDCESLKEGFKSNVTNLQDLTIRLNSSKLELDRYYLLFNYTNKNFVTFDPLYNTLFFNINININGPYNQTKIYRTIILPKNSVVDAGSLYNFKIMAILSDGRRVVLTENIGSSSLVYIDWDKEQMEKTKRDQIIITISFALSLVMGFLFSDKKISKRTQNCFMASGVSLFITARILLSGTFGHIWLNMLLILMFISFFLFTGLALYSRGKDYETWGLWRELKEIWKLIPEIWNKLFGR